MTQCRCDWLRFQCCVLHDYIMPYYYVVTPYYIILYNSKNSRHRVDGKTVGTYLQFVLRSHVCTAPVNGIM